MNEIEFWEIIEKANEKADKASSIDYILNKLVSGTEEAIFCFHDIFMVYFRALQKNRIISAAKIINPDHDDDWFDGFCAWIIFCSEYSFKSVLLEPEYLIEIVTDSSSCNFYELLCVARNAFFEKRDIDPDYQLFNNEHLTKGLTSFQKEVIESNLDFCFEIDEDADDDELAYIMPRLYEKFN